MGIDWYLQTDILLARNGWFPGRNIGVRVESWVKRLEADGFCSSVAALKVLTEYGGLGVSSEGRSADFAAASFQLDPMLLLGEGDRFKELGAQYGTGFFALGEVQSQCSLVCDFDGMIFNYFGSLLLWVAPSIRDALVVLLFGVRQERVIFFDPQ